MPLEERTGVRDLTFSRWHRENVPADCSWIDVDCCHYCRYCHTPLALFELVRGDDPESLARDCRRKVASMTGRLANRIGIPAFKVAYCGSPLVMAAVQRLGTPRVTLHSPDELATFIDQLHDCPTCREHLGGRFTRSREELQRLTETS